MNVFNRATQIIICLVIVGLSSCETNSVEIDNKNVLLITIVSVNHSDSVILRNNKQITQIIKCLNRGKKEVVKFIPKYNLKIRYKNGNVPVSLNGSSISVKNGVKYKLDCDLEQLITSIRNNTIPAVKLNR